MQKLYGNLAIYTSVLNLFLTRVVTFRHHEFAPSFPFFFTVGLFFVRVGVLLTFSLARSNMLWGSVGVHIGVALQIFGLKRREIPEIVITRRVWYDVRLPPPHNRARWLVQNNLIKLRREHAKGDGVFLPDGDRFSPAEGSSFGLDVCPSWTVYTYKRCLYDKRKLIVWLCMRCGQ